MTVDYAPDLCFYGEKHLVAWLHEHPRGRELLAEEALRFDNRRAPRERVVVLLYGNGWVEVYGDRRHVSVKMATVPFMESPEGEVAAMDYVETTLHPKDAALLWPYRRLAFDLIRKIRPSDILETKWTLWMLKALKAGWKEKRCQAR